MGLGVHSQVLELAVVNEGICNLRRAQLTATRGGWLEDRPLWHRMGGRKESNGAVKVEIFITAA